ncbi:MAG TPA: dihydrolipoamide acetyltransferase family protein [Planctomycetaceae bacterium]
MAYEVVVPRLGWSMDEGTFGEWLKRDGEFVDKGQALFVLEGEKSAQDIESFDAGILRIPPEAPQPGDTVKVGQVLAFLVEKDEAAPISAAAAKPQAAATPEPKQDGSEPCVAADTDSKTSRSDPGANASPRARRRAEELGVDWTNLGGTGSTGRIRERDVVAAAKPPAAPSASPGPRKSSQPLAMSRLRQTIAARMMAGAHETAPVTLTMPCDATNLVSLRQQFQAARRETDEIVPNYNDLIVKLTAAVLDKHPLLTARWAEREIVLAIGLHISVAVDTEAGLVAPVVRDVDHLTLRELAAEIRRLAARANSGALTDAEMQGGVFTITNLGMLGVAAFTPIINLPQVAILGVGAIVREPAVVDDKIVIRDKLTLSLTFDHRVVDGAPAARFLADLRQAIEQPGPSLVP